MTDRTELRRLLDEATLGPWEAKTSEATMNNRSGWRIGHPRQPQVFFATMRDQDAYLIAAAVNALPSLLDQLDAAEAALARVRELHASSGTAESQGYLPGGGYGYIAPYCTGCVAWDEYATAWPCPTITAIGGDR